MKKVIGVIVLIFFCNYDCSAASVGFNAPSKIFLPGEIFTNDIVINYNSSEQIPTNVFLNVQWNGDTIDIRTTIWNESDFDFSEHLYFNSYSNYFTNTFLYSQCAPYRQKWIANTNLIIARLVCAVVGHEFCNFEFNYFTNDIPYPTSAFDINGQNIIGDTNIFYDGFDVLPVITRAAAGYKLSAKINASDIAIIRDKTNFVLDLQINRFGNPLPYKQIKAVLDYDETIVECGSNIFDVPDWLEFYKFTIETTNILYKSSMGIFTNEEPTGVIIFEAETPITNYAGSLAKINFKPIDYDENEFEFDEVDTYVKRNGVNLLGLVDETDDGMENSAVYVLPAENMRFILKFIENSGSEKSVSSARLYLTAATEEYLDKINFSFYFDTNKIVFSENDDVSFKISESFTNNSAFFFYTEDLTNSFKLYNQIGNVFILFDDLITNKQDELLYLGELSWTNCSAGNANFFFNIDDAAIESEGRNLIDDEKQFTEFPATLPVLSSNDFSDYFDVIKIIPETLTNFVMQPGESIMLDLCEVGARGDTAGGQVVWKYNSEIFKPVFFSNNIWTNRLPLENGALTSDVFGIIDDFFPLDYTTTVGKIEFQALKGGCSYLEPVFEMSAVTDFFGEDVIGSLSITNDGITGLTIVCKEPEEIFLRLEPTEDLFAGKISEFILELLNPLTSEWTSLRVEIEFDEDEIQILNSSWDAKINVEYPQIIIETNFIEKTTKIKNVNNYKNITSSVYKATLQLSSQTPVITDLSEIIASFQGIPLDDEINYDFYLSSSNKFYDLTYIKNYDKNLLNDDAILDQEEWLVSQSGVKIWVESEETKRPIIQSPKNMYVHVDNPNGVQFDHITLAWSYDANDFEIMTAETADSITGSVWINNHDDGDGHFYADLFLPEMTSNLELKILNFSILPKLTDVLELELDSIDLSYTNEIEAGVWRGDLNLLETLDDSVFDTCQEWKRGPELTQHPLLYIADIYDLVSDETILELNASETGLEVFRNNIDYKWWAEGNTNIQIEFNNKSMVAKILAKSNWTGQETFWIYCLDMNNNLISKDSVQINVNNPHYNWNDFSIYIKRENYYTITDYEFNDLKFEIKNPPEKFDVYAYIIDNDNSTNQLALNLNETAGNIVWHTPNSPGNYKGFFIATNYFDPTDIAYANFQIEVVDGYYNTEKDGDRFMVLYNDIPTTLDVPTKINIKNGNDTDKLKIKVWKNKQRGDGIVKFDEITSDHGLKKIFLPGSVNLIETDGPLGSVIIKKGVVGQINVKRGGIDSVRISTGWDRYYQAFYEAGLLNGIYSYGNIGTVKIIGGSIGDDYYPATILSEYGNIGKIITKMKKRVYFDGIAVPDNKYVEIAGDDGANIFASIYALRGSIGAVVAIGGVIGTEIIDSTTKIYASGTIDKIFAAAKKGDEEILGGSVLSDIYAGNDITLIKTKGGNIAGSLDVMDSDGELDETELIEYPIIIRGGNIYKIISIGKKYRFISGPTKDDIWNELHGGNISACIQSDSMICCIKSKAGSLCVNVEAENEIKKIKATSILFKEYWDDPKLRYGGNLLYSVIMPNVEYRSTKSSDYRSYIGSMKIFGTAKNSWMGTSRPYSSKTFYFFSLVNSEVWVNGRKAN